LELAANVATTKDGTGTSTPPGGGGLGDGERLGERDGLAGVDVITTTLMLAGGLVERGELGEADALAVGALVDICISTGELESRVARTVVGDWLGAARPSAVLAGDVSLSAV
jgi:hypothetical protein